MSTESTLSQTPPASSTEHCATCSSPLAPDQRYCLECGERRMLMSSVLRDGPATSADRTPPPATPPSQQAAPREPAGQRNTTLNVIAGVGVLLLAMGVGVLIGRSGASSKQSAAPPQVITVNAGGAGSAGTPAEATFSSDWPAGTKGYTVQLQTLPASSGVSAVEAAKAAATAKGAKAVGALKAEEFSSLSSGGYVIYAGVYHKRAEAQRALAGLKASFPSATVIEVSNGSSGSNSNAASEPATTQPGGTGNSINKPAPPSVLEGLHNSKGKSYVEKSKALPNVVSTG